ncbi:MAG: putative toxin-antitoxin system toxin component, PIN family [Microcystis sp. M114S2]|jgi:putative PIN family toxin of toxin-antitoxin system|uniref:putative toxin-antitoxin system toxin component, PIN family n=1 Tax=unclassified Microcystis TaxID=2643300 RepID=UPI00258667BB|nr:MULTISPECIES: putative toxin-antitoxin system toxin component, PIN family [unclassified Microcystis]MCA2665999.1 putative toxin-antitoxin system toxin component, PIN family [Microcystis sp. M045S2]MCA2714735.1 putative toxin-antitoxin system toxin component, PIN family [Microcystis sp. M172S2]MCA2803333.1 putative toxin-antitoxin system toxin component, PIN family [Microcystis sp. M114S2]MCA2832379.1 putative toxin-antitoxin system toxin component, PIN family [Microcystis sp. M007S1]MCA2838
MKVIVDTNILVSAVLKGRRPREIVQFISDHSDIDWIVSQEILAESREVLNRRKLKLTDEVRQEWLDKIETIPKVIEVNVTVDFARDAKDAKFIALARVSEADFLITGDRDFEEMIELEQTVIISVSLFYDLFIGEGEYE